MLIMRVTKVTQIPQEHSTSILTPTVLWCVLDQKTVQRMFGTEDLVVSCPGTLTTMLSTALLSILRIQRCWSQLVMI